MARSRSLLAVQKHIYSAPRTWSERHAIVWQNAIDPVLYERGDVETNDRIRRAPRNRRQVCRCRADGGVVESDGRFIPRRSYSKHVECACVVYRIHEKLERRFRNLTSCGSGWQA